VWLFVCVCVCVRVSRVLCFCNCGCQLDLIMALYDFCTNKEMVPLVELIRVHHRLLVAVIDFKKLGDIEDAIAADTEKLRLRQLVACSLSVEQASENSRAIRTTKGNEKIADRVAATQHEVTRMLDNCLEVWSGGAKGCLNKLVEQLEKIAGGTADGTNWWGDDYDMDFEKILQVAQETIMKGDGQAVRKQRDDVIEVPLVTVERTGFISFTMLLQFRF
jgi:hypothetical protein